MYRAGNKSRGKNVEKIIFEQYILVTSEISKYWGKNCTINLSAPKCPPAAETQLQRNREKENS